MCILVQSGLMIILFVGFMVGVHYYEVSSIVIWSYWFEGSLENDVPESLMYTYNG